MHVGKGTVHCQKFGKVRKLGKPRSRLIPLPRRSHFKTCYRLSEIRRPLVEEGNADSLQFFSLQIRLHCVHLGHTVRDRRSRGEYHALIAAVQFVDILAFEFQIARPLACRGGNAGNVVHFGEQELIFVVMRFVDEQVVHAEIFKDQDVIFLIVVEQFFELRFAVLLDLFEIFDRAARHPFIHPRRFNRLFDTPDLFLYLADLPFWGNGDLCKRTLRDDDRVPIAHSDFGNETLSLFL